MIKTKNSGEGWHRKFNQKINALYPTLRKLIRCIQGEQNFKVF